MDTRDQDKEQGNDPAEDQGFADVLEEDGLPWDTDWVPSDWETGGNIGEQSVLFNMLNPRGVAAYDGFDLGYEVWRQEADSTGADVGRYSTDEAINAGEHGDVPTDERFQPREQPADHVDMGQWSTANASVPDSDTPSEARVLAPSSQAVTESSRTQTTRSREAREPQGFPCHQSGCKRVYDRACDLRKHQLIHSPLAKRHLCKVCGKPFQYPKDVKRHEKGVHRLGTPEIQGPQHKRVWRGALECA